MKTRDFCWRLIDKDNVEIKACPKWARDLQAVDFFNRDKKSSQKTTSLKNSTSNCSK